MDKLLRNKTAIFLFVAPALILFTLVLFIPICISIYYSLCSYAIETRAYTFVGLKNYVALFKDPIMLTALKNSLFFLVFSCVSQLIMGLILAGLLALKEVISGIYVLRVINLTKEISGAKIVGKISTFFLDITVLLILLFPEMPQWIPIVLSILCFLSMLLSFYWYVSTFSARIKAEKAKQREDDNEERTADDQSAQRV